MPALDALVADFATAHTQVLGASVDSHFSHAAWGETLGGISFPLLADFHPKGAVAKSFGLFLEEAGITDRATVIIDAGGTVRFLESVTPAGKRDMNDLLARCQEIDSAYDGKVEDFVPPKGLAAGTTLYVKDPCTFSRWALSARENLHQTGLIVKNVSTDAAAKAELEGRGKNQAPALLVGDELTYESADIIGYIAEHCSTL